MIRSAINPPVQLSAVAIEYSVRGGGCDHLFEDHLASIAALQFIFEFVGSSPRARRQCGGGRLLRGVLRSLICEQIVSSICVFAVNRRDAGYPAQIPLTRTSDAVRHSNSARHSLELGHHVLSTSLVFTRRTREQHEKFHPHHPETRGCPFGFGNASHHGINAGVRFGVICNRACERSRMAASISLASVS